MNTHKFKVSIRLLIKSGIIIIFLCLLHFNNANAITSSSRSSFVIAGASPFQDSLWTVQYNTWTIMSRLMPTLTGFTITGINGLATHPLTGVQYAILKLSGVTNRVLATIDIHTGICTQIGNLGDKFSSISFRSDGQLFGVTGNGATVPETLFLIDITNATTTIAGPLSAGADGEIICFNPDDNFFYHWSGNGTVVFEKIMSVAPYTATNIPLTGTTNGETFGALYMGGGQFIISNIVSTFNYYTTTGNVSPQFGSNPDDIRGLVKDITNSSISTNDSTIIGCGNASVSLIVNGGIGGYQWYKNGTAITGENNPTYVATTPGLYNCVYTDQLSTTDSVAAGINITPCIYSTRTSKVIAGASPFQDSLWTVDPNTWAILSRIKPTLTGFTITGINGLATHPITGVQYAILKLFGVTNRVLATIDIQTGICTQIGNLGDKFSSITFRSDGQLFGVTGNGAAVPETMFLINQTNATTTIAAPMVAGADGEIICFNPDDNFIYHWSGNGTVVFEKIISVAPYTATNIPLTGTTNGETFGALYMGSGQFIISNIGSKFNYFTTTGNVSPQFGSNPDDLRGLVYVKCNSSISATNLTIGCNYSGVLLTVNGGVGGYQWYKDGIQLAGETNPTYMATTSGNYNCIFTDKCLLTDSLPVGMSVTDPNRIGNVIFSEDFDNVPGATSGGAGTYSFPTGWSLFDVDGKTPDPGVSYIQHAWERREDFAFNTLDSCAFSTSWYSPAGQADDWMVTPAISLGVNSYLKWDALAYDPLFPDGYEVRLFTSPPTSGNLLSSTILQTIAAENPGWTTRYLSLAAYANQTVYIAYRNNSVDQFLLLIDDVSVIDTVCTSNIVLNLKLYLEGYYSGSTTGLMDNNGIGGCLFVNGISPNYNDADTISISLINPTTLATVETQKTILKTDGTCSITFGPSIIPGSPYYIRVKHRNAIQTWSANPVIVSAITSYDFSDAATKAYGSNMVLTGTPPRWSIYSGDFSDASTGTIGVQDDIVDSQDYLDMENAVSVILFGYVPQDLSGDAIVESYDYSTIENNVAAIIFSMHP